VEDQEDEVRRLDPSRLTYPEWIRFFFDRPIQGKIFWDEIRQYDEWREIAEPTRIVQHLQKLSLEHKAIRKAYSEEQVDQGLWAIFATYLYHEVLFDIAVDLEMRIRCIESMFYVFSDVVASLEGDVTVTFYWMWWDYMGHEPWGYGHLPENRIDRQQTLDAIIRTLAKILNLPHRGCQWSALHGLGHCDHHPNAREIVQQYLDAHGAELSDDDRRWVEGCRECRIM
jgi:hypothetical protein